MTFDLYPAIDLRNGKVVRLELGDPNRQTTFSSDPVTIARRWIHAGARWLHVVNLDGAFNEADTANERVLSRLARLPVPIQFGGGLRTLEDVQRVLEVGVARVVLGTVAIENPAMVADAVAQFGAEHIAVGIDTYDNRVKTHGWQRETAVSALTLGQQMKEVGVQTVIATDIRRDGVLTGVNTFATTELAQKSGLQVIISGGVASLGDIYRTRQLAEKGIVGLIIGRALYEGRIDLQEALSLL